jgi:hypothetical protein
VTSDIAGSVLDVTEVLLVYETSTRHWRIKAFNLFFSHYFSPHQPSTSHFFPFVAHHNPYLNNHRKLDTNR